MDKAEIGKKIKVIRLAEKMNQVNFAECLGVSQGSLSEIESGKSFPSIECLFELVNKFDVNLNSMINNQHNIPFHLTQREQDLIRDVRKLQEIAKEEVVEFVQMKLKRFELQ
jgi:transcriptional regulator with XRE-family HTH domain